MNNNNNNNNLINNVESNTTENFKLLTEPKSMFILNFIINNFLILSLSIRSNTCASSTSSFYIDTYFSTNISAIISTNY